MAVESVEDKSRDQETTGQRLATGSPNIAWMIKLALDRKTKRLTLECFGDGIRLSHVAQWYRIHLTMQETQEIWASILDRGGWKRGLKKAIPQNLFSA